MGLAPSGSNTDPSIAKRSFHCLCQGRAIPICILLFALVVWAYLPSLDNGFVDYDDDVYVTANLRVQKGLTLENLRWAFANLDAGFWHPVTWLSHMLDVELYGLKAGGHHATSLLLHSVNTLLLFLTLRRMTAAIWQSAWVAALFALHPFHVESVAWMAERKDLLCTLFFLLSLWTYTRYAECRCQTNGQRPGSGTFFARLLAPAARFYLLTLLFFALALMSKAMVVTLPLVLLLLDYWPLRRFEPSALNPPRSALLGLMREKIPFLALAGALTVVTFYAEKNYGAVSNSDGPPVGLRLANGLVSYVRYLGRTFWPVDLAVFYPYPESIAWGQVVGAGAVLLGVTAFVVSLSRKPYWIVGWFWYLGTLLPVIGLIQVGSHSMADRYTYIPLIGVFMSLAWAMHELTSRWRFQTVILSVVGSAVVLLCVALTRHQITYWKDGETLFRHATAAIVNNSMANYNLAIALFNNGRFAEAVDEFQKALRLRPDDADAHYNCGVALGRQGRLDEAISQLEEALRLRPDHAEARCNLGVAFTRKGRLDEAITQYQAAPKLKPDYAEAQTNLRIALSRKEALGTKPPNSTQP